MMTIFITVGIAPGGLEAGGRPVTSRCWMEFIAPDPKATVRTANVSATVAAFRLVPRVASEILGRRHLGEAERQKLSWVPVQRWLDALHDIQAVVGAVKVRDVGRGIIEHADFPPSFRDVPDVLMGLQEIYMVNHRGNVGAYRVSRRGASIVVACATPYPRAFEHGLVLGITGHRGFGPGRWSVDYQDGPPNGDVTCTLTVTRMT
ncbi:MAG: hypothetical protein EOO75_11565 [Myxococcales bacterium]|nr:MAG: hypothetical protein EOO75_11565 [Myxococcales bacterium]